jgi:hypothetical protein
VRAVNPQRSKAMTTAHYRLTSDEFLAINSKLTNAQLRVYLHYKTLDPFGDRRIEICTKAIAETLGITQRSVQLALNKLSSMGLLVWEKAKSFVRRNVDRLGEMNFAAAKSVSSTRNVDRERQLELFLGADSTTPQSSSILFNLDQDQDDDFLNDFGDDNHDDSIEEEGGAQINDFGDDNHDDSIEEGGAQISVDEAIAEIRAALCDESRELCDESHELCDESDRDLLLSNETEQQQGIEDKGAAKTDLQLSTSDKANGIEGGDSFRRRVEDFILKKLGKSPKNRAAYFAKFSPASWQKWEMDYKASLVTPPPYKPYIPEKVEVAAPDSPVAQSAIAFIKSKLGIKS